MFRSLYYRADNQYSWNTTSQENEEHLTVTEKMPIITNGSSPYANAHSVSNNNIACKEEITEDIHRHQQQQRNSQANHHHKHHASEAPKKVHFVESQEITEVDNVGKVRVHEEETIDMEADGFIERKHKKFQLAKWNTFEVC